MFARSTSPPTGRRSTSTDSHNPDLVTSKWTQPENLRVDGEESVGGTKPGMVITEATGESLCPWRKHWTGEPMRPGGFIRQYTADNHERDFRTPITPPGKTGSTWEDCPRTPDSQEGAVASGKWNDLAPAQRAALLDKPWGGLTSDQRAAMQVLKTDYIWYTDEGEIFLQAVVGGELDRKLQALQEERLQQARSASPTPDYHETGRKHKASSPPARADTGTGQNKKRPRTRDGASVPPST